MSCCGFSQSCPTSPGIAVRLGGRQLKGESQESRLAAPRYVRGLIEDCSVSISQWAGWLDTDWVWLVSRWWVWRQTAAGGAHLKRKGLKIELSRAEDYFSLCLCWTLAWGLHYPRREWTLSASWPAGLSQTITDVYSSYWFRNCTSLVSSPNTEALILLLLALILTLV